MRVLITSLWLLAAVAVCLAQSEKRASDEQKKPDLSGTWALDKSKSDGVEYDLTLNVLHKEPEVRITKKYVQGGREFTDESVYYTDGRAEPPAGKLKYIFGPVTKWRGRTLVRQGTFITGGTRFEVVTTEEWKLSQDDKTLTQTTVDRQKVSMNETILPTFKKKYVFARVP